MRRILPNDACPCGSGLKYKKCCGGIRRLNGDEIFNSFIESMDFMTMSIYSYDRGNISESKRIALELRKNLHDTDKSISVLKHLDKKDIYIIFLVLGMIKEIRMLIGQDCVILEFM